MDFDGIDDEEWDNLCPSDECYVELNDSKGRVYITRRSDEEYKENCLVLNFKQSPVKVMIWACFMRGVKGPLVVLEYPGGKGGGDEHRSVHFSSPQTSSCSLLPSYGEGTAWNYLPARWCI